MAEGLRPTLDAYARAARIARDRVDDAQQSVLHVRWQRPRVSLNDPCSVEPAGFAEFSQETSVTFP